MKAKGKTVGMALLAIVSSAAAVVSLAQNAPIPESVQRPDPAMAAWAKAYSANPLGWNDAWVGSADRDASLSAEQKWAMAKELLQLEAKHGARGLPAFWDEARAQLKSSMKAATKAVLERTRDDLAARKAAVDAEIFEVAK